FRRNLIAHRILNGRLYLLELVDIFVVLCPAVLPNTSAVEDRGEQAVFDFLNEVHFVQLKALDRFNGAHGIRSRAWTRAKLERRILVEEPADELVRDGVDVRSNREFGYIRLRERCTFPGSANCYRFRGASHFCSPLTISVLVRADYCIALRRLFA